MIVILVIAAVVIILFALKAVVVVPKDHVYITERMGQYGDTLSPGFHVVMPLVDTIRFKHVTSVQSQELSDVVETRDGQRASLSSAYRFHVVDPRRASYDTADYASALRELVRGSQKRHVAGQTWNALREDTRSLEAEVQRGVAEVSETVGVRLDEYAVKNLQQA